MGSEMCIRDSDTYSVRITGLTPATKYQYRFIYKDTEEVASEIVEFTTEAAIALYNANFDLWYQNGKTWYAGNPVNHSGIRVTRVRQRGWEPW